VLNPNLRTPFGPLQDFGQESFAAERQLTTLRRMIWLYFALLIAEGALRKWIAPSLTAPLLVVRDPVVLIIYVQAVRCRRFPVSGPMVVYFLLLSSFILLALFQMIAGIGGGPLVAVYGLRTNFLHLPLIFVIPQVFSYADVLKVGRWMLILSVPMAGLMIWQFLSTPDSWINAATIADVQQISFAMGKIRPAGTFSFATGAAHFFVLTTAFLIYGLAQPRANYSRWLLGAALLSVIVVQPVSGSRLLVLGCALVAVAAIVFAILARERAYRILAIAALICATLAALSLIGFFREVVTVFMVRWNSASEGSASVSLATRIVGGFLDPFALLAEAGPFGKGVGLGTNAASALMTGTPQFLLAEGEWSRVILEAGPLLGFSFLGYRAWLAGDMAVRAAVAAKQQHLLAWLLAWDACRSLVNEQFSQPTNLGFVVFVSGLCLAAMPAGRSALAAERAAGSEQPSRRKTDTSRASQGNVAHTAR
jgi:hypothetical protein